MLLQLSALAESFPFCQPDGFGIRGPDRMQCVRPRVVERKEAVRERVIRHALFYVCYVLFWRLGCFHPSKLRAQGLAPFSLV